MSVKITKLRKDIYQLLDDVIATGKPLEVERGDNILKIIPSSKKRNKFERLVQHDCIAGDAEELVHMDWSDQWQAGEL